MIVHRHFRKAPITEAIIDIKVQPPANFDVARFENVREVIADKYPERIEIFEFKGQLAMKKGETVANTTKTIVGYGFKSKDKVNIVQFRRDGFAHNRLKPYTSWGEVLTEALRVWSIYKQVATPVVVTRIAARYINHINVPLVDDLSTYLVELPSLPDDTQTELNGFLTRFVVRDRNSDVKANIIQALEGGLTQKSANVILDIDAYKQKQYDPESDFEKMSSDFEQIREFKDRIFFSYITEKTARLFE